MYKYLLLGIPFLALSFAAATRIKKPDRKILYIVLGFMLIATAVGDSLIIHLGIVDYMYESTLSIKIGKAPIEDFFYTILATCLGLYLWKRYDTSN